MGSFFSLLLDYIDRSNAITLLVLAWLSLYFIITVWIYIARYFTLRSEIVVESASLESILMGSRSVASGSFLEGCANAGRSSEILFMCKTMGKRSNKVMHSDYGSLWNNILREDSKSD